MGHQLFLLKNNFDEFVLHVCPPCSPKKAENYKGLKASEYVLFNMKNGTIGNSNTNVKLVGKIGREKKNLKATIA